MEKNIQTIIRSILIIFGIILLLFGIYNIYTNIQDKIIPSIVKHSSDLNIDMNDYISNLIFVILGYILIKIGTSWSNIFKSFAVTFISFAVIFFTLAITIYPFYSNSQEITDSVQPSIDYIIAGSFDKIVTQQITINNGKNVNLILNGKTTSITIGEIDKTNTDIIWKNLNLNENVSYETKNFTVNFLLTLVSNELEKNEALKNIPIPINLLSQYFEGTEQSKDIKKIIEYDFFNPDISLRVKNFENLRVDCENKQVTLNEICNPLELTKYETLIQNASEMQNSQIPAEFTNILKEIETKDKLNLYIKKQSSSWVFCTVIGIILLILGTFFYYLHFKLFNREYQKVEIPYFISKINLINFVPAYIILVIIYYLIIGKELINFISQFIPKELLFSVNIIMATPLFILSMKLLWQIMIISTIYLIVSFMLFITFYIILKKEEKKIPTIEENS